MVYTEQREVQCVIWGYKNYNRSQVRGWKKRERKGHMSPRVSMTSAIYQPVPLRPCLLRDEGARAIRVRRT